MAGATFAISASGLVVTYATTGVFNFAHGAVGMVCCLSRSGSWRTTTRTAPCRCGWRSHRRDLVEAPLLGIIIERVFMRRLHGASTARSLMVTLGMLLILLGVAEGVWSGHTTRPAAAVLPERERPGRRGAACPGRTCSPAAVAVVVAVVLWAFFRRFRIGVAMRAVVDDPELLAMAGAQADPRSHGWDGSSARCWPRSAASSSVRPQGNIDPTTLTLVVINSFAAAVVGRMRSLPWTFVGAVLLGLFDNYVIGYAPGGLVVALQRRSCGADDLPVRRPAPLPQDRLRAIGRPDRGRGPAGGRHGSVARR